MKLDKNRIDGKKERIEVLENKFSAKNKLIKIDLKFLPNYITNNYDKFKEWID